MTRILLQLLLLLLLLLLLIIIIIIITDYQLRQGHYVFIGVSLLLSFLVSRIVQKITDFHKIQ